MYDSTQMIESEQFFARPVQVEAHFQWDCSCTFVVLNDALVNIPTFLIDGLALPELLDMGYVTQVPFTMPIQKSIQILALVLCGFDTVIRQSELLLTRSGSLLKVSWWPCMR